MLNQNHNVHKRTNSKILLIVICIFGLLFSWSCSCKNRVTGVEGVDGEDDKTKSASFIPKANPSSQLSLIASEDGTTKTQVTISFFEENSHNIKSAKATKIVDDKGNDITDKATYVFSDGKFSFIKQSDLQGILTGMVSTSEPATNTLTVTFEITTDSTEVLNTTATVDVNVYLVKTQKFDNQATILQGIISGIGEAGLNKFLRFNFAESGKAGLDMIELGNADDGNGTSTHSASEYADDIINNRANSIKKNRDYQKYFDNVVYSIIGGEPDGTSTKFNFTLTFTPKNIYDMALTNYTIKLDTLTAGNWIK